MTRCERILAVISIASILLGIGGALTGWHAIQKTEAAYAIAAEKSTDLRNCKALLQEEMAETARLRDELRRGGRAPVVAGAPGTLAAANFNPLNVKSPGKGQLWQGQIGVDRIGHARFATVEDGLRAAAFTLVSYYGRHGIDTIDGIVGRFSENNHAEYAAFLSEHLGIPTDRPFDVLSKLPRLMRCMACFENGGVWLRRELFTGYDVAASAWAKGRTHRASRKDETGGSVVAVVAPKPQDKPKAKAQPKAQPKATGTASNHQRKPAVRAVAEK